MGGAYYYYRFISGNEPATVLKVYGNVDIRQVDLAFFATGRVAELLREEGEYVKEGELLARLDASRYEAALAQSEAHLAALREDLSIKETGSRPQRIREARAAVAAAKARVKEAERSYDRFKALRKSRSISKQTLDDAELRYRTARADLKQARQNLSLTLEGPRDEAVAAARAKVEAAQAAVRLARSKLEDTRIYAPSNAVIQERILEKGDMAFPQIPVYTLALIDPVWVRAYLPEPYLGRIVPGYRAEITTDSYPNKVYPGWIGYISPTAEFTPKHVQTEELRTKLVYQVRVHVCNPEGELRLGMPVTIGIPFDQRHPGELPSGRKPCQGE